MDKTKVVRKKTDEKKIKGIVMSIRVNKHMSEFMKDNNYSPSLIFYEALRELGYKE